MLRHPTLKSCPEFFPLYLFWLFLLYCTSSCLNTFRLCDSLRMFFAPVFRPVNCSVLFAYNPIILVSSVPSLPIGMQSYLACWITSSPPYTYSLSSLSAVLPCFSPSCFRAYYVFPDESERKHNPKTNTTRGKTCPLKDRRLNENTFTTLANPVLV